jgi:hypothetical protein
MSRLLVVLCLLLAALVATSAADTHFVVLSGSGSLLADRAGYGGTILAGFTGTWELNIDSRKWPDASANNGRFEYIWEEFFEDNYDDTPGSEAWYGYFDSSTLRKPPRLALDTVEPKGHLQGDASLVIMVRDLNGDGVLSQAEKDHNCQLTMTLVVDSSKGRGVFRQMCGSGGLGSGDFNFVEPPGEDGIQIVGSITLEDCP